MNQKNSLSEPITNRVRGMIEATGLTGHLVHEHYNPKAFGNSVAVFRIDSLLLHFLRDRGQEFISVASSSAPDSLYISNDIDLAMGWRTMDEVLSQKEPEPIEAVFQRLRAGMNAVEALVTFHPDRIVSVRTERMARMGWGPAAPGLH